LELRILLLQSDFLLLTSFVTSVTFSTQAQAHYTSIMSSKPGLSRIICAQCEQLEAKCWCEKFCVLCQSEIAVRLCTDGLLYCEPCRTACEYKTAD
jgi:hypothetical protein